MQLLKIQTGQPKATYAVKAGLLDIPQDCNLLWESHVIALSERNSDVEILSAIRASQVMIENTSYYSQYRSELLPFVPKGIKTSLDIGCGEGFFSAGIKTQYSLEAWGVEMTPDAATKAASRLDNVLPGTFDEVYDRLPTHYFDCIFFNDVLEHMVDPWAVLARSKQLLTNKGTIVCSIPNVRYLPHLYELLVKKDWRYRDAGVLDRTHLRFFTKRSIIEMFVELDYTVIQVAGINRIQSWKTRLLYRIINLVFLGSFRDSCYLQFACVVKPDLSTPTSSVPSK